MKKSILFIQPTNSTFMEIDYQILKSAFPIDRIVLRQESKYLYGKNLFWATISSLLYNRYELYIVWFADYHSFLFSLITRLLHRKLYIFIGGYETYYYPELHLGIYGNKFRGWCVKYSLKHCELLIANHQSLIDAKHDFLYEKGHLDGIKNIIPGLCTPYRIIYNGFQPPSDYDVNIVKENIVMTVGTTPTWNDVINKGYDLLVDSARQFPDLSFVLIGIQDKWLNRFEQLTSYKVLGNVTIFPYIRHTELYGFYSKCKIYIQASIIEGMPNALIEAMFFNCIPIGSNVAGIPTVIGDCGIILMKRDSMLLKNAINQALLMPFSNNPQQRIINNFSFARRKEQILLLIID